MTGYAGKRASYSGMRASPGAPSVRSPRLPGVPRPAVGRTGLAAGSRPGRSAGPGRCAGPPAGVLPAGAAPAGAARGRGRRGALSRDPLTREGAAPVAAGRRRVRRAVRRTAAGRRSPGRVPPLGAGRRPGAGRPVASAVAGHGAGDGPGDFFLQGAARGFASHEIGHHVAHLGEPPHGLGVPGHQEVQAALRAIVDGRRPRRRLVQHLLGLGLGGRHRVLRLLLRVADGALRLGAGGGAGLLRFGPGGRDGVLRLLLCGGQHPLGLLARLGLEPVDLLLRLVALLGDLLEGAGLLRLGLIVGQAQNLRHPLAELLMGRLVGHLPLTGRRHLGPQALDLVHGAGQPLLIVALVALGAGHEFVDLTATVAAHLHFERVFRVEVRDKVVLLSHGVTRQVGQGQATPGPARRLGRVHLRWERVRGRKIWNSRQDSCP